MAPEAMTLNDCPPEKLQKATELCLRAQPGFVGEELDTCSFDVCFGGDQYAIEDGLAEGEAASFDCEAGYDHWEIGWSLTKKKWCCAYCGRACGPYATPKPLYEILIITLTGTVTLTSTTLTW